MSYDVTLYVMRQTPGLYTDVYEANITSNLGAMFRLALGVGFKELAGMKAADAEPILAEAVWDMTMDERKYTPLNPANGWGSYESGLLFLRRLLQACQQNPDADIRISY
jgi:hypothetical protein